ncbi:MAG: tetratricopeptide repeat protein [Candidatus Cybelea sp.]
MIRLYPSDSTLLLAELLRQCRTEAHLSQEELAERAGVAARTIGDLETGVSLSPHAITISLISEALGLDAQRREALRAVSRRRGLAVSRELPEAVSLIGREVELEAVLSLIRDDAVRLVTLTGGPGVGKTALATAAAKELTSDYGERIRYIDFGNLPEATLVPTKILLAFGVRDVWGDSITHSIATALAGPPMLMIADNFERVATAAPFIAELLAAAPQLKVLVASRVRIRLRAEHTISVGWLSLESSLALLARRVQVWSPEFRLPQQDDGAFTALAKALGGVPLAIELAAPLLRSTSAQELASRLQRVLDVLGSPDRRGRTRQRTMRDAINSSYILLEPGEQRLFRRLSVFGGHFTEEAARQVVSDDGPADTLQTLRALAALLDHSLVSASTNGSDEAEFEIHPLVGEFAAELLEREGEREAAYLSLTEYCLALANAQPRPEPLYEPATRHRLNRESAHFDIALGWLKNSGRLPTAFSLALAAAPNWIRRGESAHGYAWISSLLGDPELRVLDDALLAEVHWVASSLAKASDMDRVDAHIAIALPLKRALGDRSAVASLLDGLGVGAYLRGEYKKGRAFCEEGLAIRRELGDGLLVARSLIDLGACAADEGEFAEATRHLEEALVLFRAAGRSTGVSAVLGNLALVTLRAGSASRCELLARESIDLAERVGFVEAAKASKIVLSRALLALGDIDQAETLACSVASEESTPVLLGDVARVLASIAFAREKPRVASRLLGAASNDPIALPLAEREPHDRLVGSLRASLGRDFQVEYELGAAKGRELFATLDFRE